MIHLSHLNYICLYLNYLIISDSLAHLNTSLDSLVKDLKSEGPAAFKPVRDYVNDTCGGEQECYDLLMRKGVRLCFGISNKNIII